MRKRDTSPHHQTYTLTGRRTVSVVVEKYLQIAHARQPLSLSQILQPRQLAPPRVQQLCLLRELLDLPKVKLPLERPRDL